MIADEGLLVPPLRAMNSPHVSRTAPRAGWVSRACESQPIESRWVAPTSSADPPDPNSNDCTIHTILRYLPDVHREMGATGCLQPLPDGRAEAARVEDNPWHPKTRFRAPPRSPS